MLGRRERGSGERPTQRDYIYYLDCNRCSAFWKKILVVHFRYRVQAKLPGLYEICSIISSLS